MGRYVGYFVDNSKGTLSIIEDEVEWLDEYAAQFAGTREEVLRYREALYLISGAAASAGWEGFDPEKALIKIEQYANNALKPI